MDEMSQEQQLVPGITVSPLGQATVDPTVTEALFDLAIKLEESTDLPVDIEHVLAAIVLASRAEELASTTPLSSQDPALMQCLSVHVKTIFADYRGTVGSDEDDS